MLQLPVHDLVRIVAAGGGVTVSATAYNINDLVRVVSHAASGASVTITDAQTLGADNLVGICSFAKGPVSFV